MLEVHYFGPAGDAGAGAGSGGGAPGPSAGAAGGAVAGGEQPTVTHIHANGYCKGLGHPSALRCETCRRVYGPPGFAVSGGLLQGSKLLALAILDEGQAAMPKGHNVNARAPPRPRPLTPCSAQARDAAPRSAREPPG